MLYEIAKKKENKLISYNSTRNIHKCVKINNHKFVILLSTKNN